MPLPHFGISDFLNIKGAATIWIASLGISTIPQVYNAIQASAMKEVLRQIAVEKPEVIHKVAEVQDKLLRSMIISIGIGTGTIFLAGLILCAPLGDGLGVILFYMLLSGGIGFAAARIGLEAKVVDRFFRSFSRPVGSDSSSDQRPPFPLRCLAWILKHFDPVSIEGKPGAGPRRFVVYQSVVLCGFIFSFIWFAKFAPTR